MHKNLHTISEKLQGKPGAYKTDRLISLLKILLIFQVHQRNKIKFKIQNTKINFPVTQQFMKILCENEIFMYEFSYFSKIY